MNCGKTKCTWYGINNNIFLLGEKLEEFLRSLNSSKPLYLGQTGLGNTEELGKLALEPGENFCMGGPGMIFSREVLRRMVPHIGECLREMYTTHEDVEVGRCVRRFGGTQCVWSYEVRNNRSWDGFWMQKCKLFNKSLVNHSLQATVRNIVCVFFGFYCSVAVKHNWTFVVEY